LEDPQQDAQQDAVPERRPARDEIAVTPSPEDVRKEAKKGQQERGGYG
jgi:hypothetical protein